jgi:hypothetical protein
MKDLIHQNKRLMTNLPPASVTYYFLREQSQKIFVSIITETNYLAHSRPSVAWMYQGASCNKLAHMLNGNRNRCYNIGMWKCRKGQTNRENFPTAKIVDVKDFLMTNDLQLLCLIEADLLGITSRRVKHITSKEIEENLKIENYKIILPQSWQVHGQARVILYVTEDINLKVRPLARENSDQGRIKISLRVILSLAKKIG